MKHKKMEFWVTNISSTNVSLSDLALTIKARSTVNLLDEKHYNFTLEQLLKSKASGSLFKKSNKIIYRLIPPSEEKNKISVRKENIMPSRHKSIFVIEQKEYEELNIDANDQKTQDEIYAKENVDLAEIDIQRSINKQR